MMGSFLSRALLIIAATFTVLERFGDTCISWLPLYSEAKLAFFVYLWYPKTKGSTHVYNSFFRPYMMKHETEIDHSLWELRIKFKEIAMLFWQKALNYSQRGVFDILHYVSNSQSASRSHAADQVPSL
ncbi:HVA22-like protein [Quillaja saponaria]|uniref:HVA22-like protein n=1 Tax=Quillaja saponaria TaxID=32244 RepID=A0AAD7VK13_QUISA|nr:HVA22-like protein [Quillaja saponaria]